MNVRKWKELVTRDKKEYIKCLTTKLEQKQNINKQKKIHLKRNYTLATEYNNILKNRNKKNAATYRE